MEKVNLCKFLLVFEGEVGKLVQPGGMWGLPWGLLCGTSGRKDLCMVPCHSYHIYGFDKQEQKCVGNAWKSLIVGGNASHKRGALFIGKAGSHCVILLYCKTLLQVLLGIYCKRCYWIPLSTILQLFSVFEVGKAKSATQSVLMKHWMGYSSKIFNFFALPLKIHYP